MGVPVPFLKLQTNRSPIQNTRSGAGRPATRSPPWLVCFSWRLGSCFSTVCVTKEKPLVATNIQDPMENPDHTWSYFRSRCKLRLDTYDLLYIFINQHCSKAKLKILGRWNYEVEIKPISNSTRNTRSYSHVLISREFIIITSHVSMSLIWATNTVAHTEHFTTGMK